MRQWFVLDVNPEPWAIGPVGAKRSGGRIAAFVGRNQQLAAYKEAIAESLQADYPNLVPLDGPVKLTFYFWRKRATYTTPQQRAHQKHDADLTNLQKSTEDALQGILFDNDKSVVEVSSMMVKQSDELESGMVVICVDQADLFTRYADDMPMEVMQRILSIRSVAPQMELEWGDGTEDF